MYDSNDSKQIKNPSNIEWDLTNGPLSKLLELLDTQVEGSVQWVLLEISWKNILLRQPSFQVLGQDVSKTPVRSPGWPAVLAQVRGPGWECLFRRVGKGRIMYFYMYFYV